MRHTSWMLLLLVSIGGCEGGHVPDALGTSDGTPLVVSLRDDTLVQLSGRPAGEPLRLHVESSSGDTTYRTNWALGTGSCLRVVPRAGEPVVIEGAPIVVDYYHVGRMLGVSVGPAGSAQLYSFIEPISYQTVPCPTP